MQEIEEKWKMRSGNTNEGSGNKKIESVKQKIRSVKNRK